MRILVVEDDVPVANFIRKGLETQRYTVECARDGEEAQRRLRETEVDLVILDVGLPGIDGIDVLKYTRARQLSMPVLMLTARNKIEDRVQCLDLGADDYLAKPFSFGELSARVRALLRRAGRPKQAKLRVADLEMDLAEHRVTRAGKSIELSAREFALLSFLMRNAGRCVTRAGIMEQVWKLPYETSTNLVDVYVNYLRAKIDKSFGPKLIHTARGAGYVLTDHSAQGGEK